jgi:hypothetical protein
MDFNRRVHIACQGQNRRETTPEAGFNAQGIRSGLSGQAQCSMNCRMDEKLKKIIDSSNFSGK